MSESKHPPFTEYELKCYEEERKEKKKYLAYLRDEKNLTDTQIKTLARKAVKEFKRQRPICYAHLIKNNHKKHQVDSFFIHTILRYIVVNFKHDYYFNPKICKRCKQRIDTRRFLSYCKGKCRDCHYNLY